MATGFLSPAPVFTAMSDADGLPVPDRLGKGSFNWPSEQQASFQRPWLEASFAFPLGNGQSRAGKGNASGRARVVRLFDLRGPSAIARLVVTVWIDSFNRVFFRCGRPHVVQEALKRRAPALAHRNATTAVGGVTGLLGVIAACLHRAPTPVSASAYGTMLRGPFRAPFIMKTAATTCEAATKRLTADVVASAAVTLAVPRHATASISCASDDHQSAKPLAGHIDEGHVLKGAA